MSGTTMLHVRVDEDIKKQAYGAGVQRTEYCNKCGRPGHTAVRCKESSCARCNLPITVNSYHECEKFVPNANARGGHQDRHNKGTHGGRGGRGGHDGKSAQGRGNATKPPTPSDSTQQASPPPSQSPALAAAYASRKQARAVLKTYEEAVKKMRLDDKTA